MLLQVRDGARPGGAHVQVPQVHLRVAAARGRGAARQDAGLWSVTTCRKCFYMWPWHGEVVFGQGGLFM